jgi:hypothetical protein
VNIDRKAVKEILTENLDMRKVYPKMVPKDPTEEQNNMEVFS